MAEHRIYGMRLAALHPLYVAKAERKGRSRAEVDAVIRWLTGYDQTEIEALLQGDTTLAAFFAAAPRMNPDRALIRGKVCGVRVEEVAEPLMREIRYLDKLVDELAQGRALDRILRKAPEAAAPGEQP